MEKDKKMISLKYLMVEDNKDHAFIVMNTIKKLDPQSSITHLSNGEEAISYLADIKDENYPDIILLDIKMPIKNGFDVLAYIRSQEELRHLPVIMLSTSSQNKEIKDSYKMGANTYLTKPVNYSEFVRIISELNDYWSDVASLPFTGEKNG